MMLVALGLEEYLFVATLAKRSIKKLQLHPIVVTLRCNYIQEKRQQAAIIGEWTSNRLQI